jgi:hypothetical protein
MTAKQKTTSNLPLPKGRFFNTKVRIRTVGKNDLLDFIVPDSEMRGPRLVKRKPKKKAKAKRTQNRAKPKPKKNSRKATAKNRKPAKKTARKPKSKLKVGSKAWVIKMARARKAARRRAA